jgi:hypothetical protein
MTVKNIVTAKNKQPTKTELLRKLDLRLATKAATDAAVNDLDAARAKCVSKTGESTGAARVYAHALIARFGPDYYTFTAANARTDNEKAHFAAIEIERKRCAADYEAKYGSDGKNMPWSRAKAVARKLREGGEPRPGKPLDTKVKAGLIALYKAYRKEERPTELEQDACDDIGEILKSHFKVDISQY